MAARVLQRVGACFAVLAFLTVGLAPADASTTTTTLPSTPPPAKAWVLVDVDTGRILAGYYKHLRLPPASLTKVLTALIAQDWLPPTATATATARDANVYPYRLGMKPGQVWSLDVLLHAVLISSDNDAAYAIAERISGSVEAFGPVMQNASTQMGMSDQPVWHDPAGLDGTEGVAGGNLASARDLAIAGRDMLAQRQLATIVPMKDYRFAGPDNAVHDISTWNLGFLNSYPGAIGVKTGFTDPAGQCLIAAAQRGSRTMMAVILNGANTVVTAAVLLNQGFATPVASEPATDVLPNVVLPEPLQQTRPAVPVDHAAAGAPGGARKVAAYKQLSDAGRAATTSGAWIAALAATLGALALLPLWRLRTRRPPLRHARR